MKPIRNPLKAWLKGLVRGVHVATPVFDGAKEEEVKNVLKHAQLPETGQTVLFDGRTGEPFEMPVTVGDDVYAKASPPGGGKDSRPIYWTLLPSFPTASWRENPSLEGKGLGKWKSGLLKLTARLTVCRNFLQ